MTLSISKKPSVLSVILTAVLVIVAASVVVAAVVHYKSDQQDKAQQVQIESNTRKADEAKRAAAEAASQAEVARLKSICIEYLESLEVMTPAQKAGKPRPICGV